MDKACYFIKHHKFIYDRKHKDYGKIPETTQAIEELAALLKVDKERLVKWYNHMIKEFQYLTSWVSRNPQTYYYNDRTENIHNSFFFLMEHLPVAPVVFQDSSTSDSN